MNPINLMVDSYSAFAEFSCFHPTLLCHLTFAWLLFLIFPYNKQMLEFLVVIYSATCTFDAANEVMFYCLFVIIQLYAICLLWLVIFIILYILFGVENQRGLVKSYGKKMIIS